jgi:hypothetical protein
LFSSKRHFDAQNKKAKKAPSEAAGFKHLTTDTSVIQPQIIDNEPVKLSEDEHIEDIVMAHLDVDVVEYSVPQKVSSKSA